MEKGQKAGFLLLGITIFILGFMAGCLFDRHMINNAETPVTSYCEKIQIDTLQYDYQRNMYKYKITLIK